MARVASSERFRRELDEVLAGIDGETDPVERIGRLGARLILQQALEDEVSEFLGRARYERVQEPVSHRNGYEPRRVVTAAGPVELERPRVRNARELGFKSRVLGRHVARTYALESLVICLFLRGLSVRDVKAALAETFEEPVIGKSTVARVCQDTRERYRRWCVRRLDEHDLVYRFLDALYLKLRPDAAPAEGVLVAWGVTLKGRKVLLGLQLGSRESYENWLAFGRDLAGRGLRAGADRGRRRFRALEDRPRAVANRRGTALHRARAAQRDRQAARAPPPRRKGPLVADLRRAASPADARRGLEAIVADYRTAYPSAMAVIERDLDALVAHLRWPTEHRKRIRSTNLLKRTFVEVRRRTKIIGRFPGETSALSLIWAVLELSSPGWRGIIMTPRSLAEIERLRRHNPAATTTEHKEVIAA